MRRSFTWLLLPALFLPTSAAHAQSRACPETPLAEDDFQDGQKVKAVILRVEFPRDFPLSEDTRAKLEKQIRDQDISDIVTIPEAPDSESLVEIYVDSEIRNELQKEGYFKATVHSRPYLVLAKADELEYIVAVEAEPGPQYRLRELEFKSAPAVGADELRNLFPLRSGDIFEVSRVREGLGAIGKLYGQLGYIDATSEAEAKVDEQNHLIDLVVNIDEQLQYRVAKFEVIGLDSETAKSLESIIEPGQVFNRASFEALFKEHQSVLPANSSPEMNALIIRNTKHATVDIVLDFRLCSST